MPSANFSMGAMPTSSTFDEVRDDKPLLPPEESIRSDARPYNDVWAALLFIAAMVVTIAFGIHGLSHPNTAIFAVEGAEVSATDAQHIALSAHRGVFLLLTAATTAYFASIGLLSLARAHAAQIIYAGNGLLLGMYFAGIITSAVAGEIGGVIALTAVFGLHALFLYLFRHRIRFAALCIEQCARIVYRHGGMIATPLAISALQVGFMALWAAGASQWLGTELETTHFVPLCVWLLFFFWGVNVLQGVIHATTCGVVAMWYFTGGAMPRNPTLGALRRACSFSFGSICLGSLIVAVINTLCAICRAIMGSDRENNRLLKAIARCLLNTLEGLAEYFNRYAFVHIAIYGTPYIESAKKTWKLVKTSAISAIVNDDFTGMAMFMLSFFVMQLSGVVCALLYRFPGVEHGWAISYGAGLVVGLIVSQAVFGTVVSGVMALFVCIVEQPSVIERTNPAFYQALKSAESGSSSRNRAFLDPHE